MNVRLADLFSMLALCGVMLVTVAGCGPTIRSGTYEVDKGSYDEAVEAVAARATFELSCAREQLTFVVVGTAKNGAGRHFVRQLGVSGCDQKAVYVQGDDRQWVKDGATTE